MIPGWQQKITEAQEKTHVRLQGMAWRRLPYGSEYPDMTMKPRCRDCGVTLGQLHVPTCCVEFCPRCGGQAISCRCR